VVLQAALQSERDRTQALLAERDRQVEEKQRELEEKTARLMEEERARNDMQNRAMYELLMVSFFCILAKSFTQCSFHY
jgi:tRNA(Ile2) C34 agmatinyltransferase TiaS